MKLILFSGALVGALTIGGSALAATFTPTFDTPSFPGTQFNVESDPSYNEFYSDNFGITVENAYLYVDARDTTDGIGIANGLVENGFNPGEAGRINFLDTTDFVDVSFASIFSGGVYSAFSAAGELIDSFATGSGTNNGSERLDGGIISYITFVGEGGTVGVSGLTYDYDGVTDGTNDDIGDGDNGGPAVVPLPASGILLLGALGALAAARRKRS